MSNATRTVIAGTIVFVVTVAVRVPFAVTADPAGTLAILPENVVLRGQGSRQQLIVSARIDDTFTRPTAAAFAFTSSNPTVATVDTEGVV